MLATRIIFQLTAKNSTFLLFVIKNLPGETVKAASLHEHHLVVGQIHLLQARTLNFETFSHLLLSVTDASDTVISQNVMAPIGFAHKIK
jgi:hypothetical protein